MLHLSTSVWRKQGNGAVFTLGSLLAPWGCRNAAVWGCHHSLCLQRHCSSYPRYFHPTIRGAVGPTLQAVQCQLSGAK